MPGAVDRNVVTQRITATATISNPRTEQVLADATGGAITVTVISRHGGMVHEVKVTKTDSSANAVTVVAGLVSVVLSAQDEAVVVEQDDLGAFHSFASNDSFGTSTPGTVVANKVVIVDANKRIAGFGAVALDGITVNSLLGMLTIGTVVTATGSNVSANTGRVAGLSVNLLNTAATISGLRGIDARAVDNGGTGAANIVGVQGVSTKTSGVGSGEQWGGNFIAHVNGGKVENVYGVVGSTDVLAAASVGSTDANTNNACGLLGTISVETGATLSTEMVSAAVIGTLTANTATAKAKLTGGFVAIIEADSSLITAGAAFKIINRSNSFASKFDFGVDLSSRESGRNVNSFAVADISLSGSLSGERLIIASGPAANDAAIVSQVGADSTIADGSLYLSTDTTGAVYMKVSDAWVTVTHA